MKSQDVLPADPLFFCDFLNVAGAREMLKA